MTARDSRIRALMALPPGNWLSSQPRAFQDRVISIARFRNVKAGDTIWHIGDEVTGILGMIGGCASVHWTTANAETTMFHLIWPGDWMGEQGFIKGGTYRTGVQARTDATIVILGEAELHEILRENSDWWRSIAALASDHTIMAVDTYVDMMIRNPVSRCISVLLRGAGARIQSDDEIRSRIVPLTHEELGQLTNLSRNAVGAILHDLQAEGLIQRHYRSIELKQISALRARLRDWPVAA